MKNFYITLFLMGLLTACSPKEIALDPQVDLYHSEVLDLAPAIVDQLYMASAREVSMAGEVFAVIDFKRPARSRLDTPLYLIKNQWGDWGIVSDHEDHIYYQALKSAKRWQFNRAYDPVTQVERIQFDSLPMSARPLTLTKNESDCPHCTRGYFIDIGLCTISTTTMALADGPLPFGDYLAAAYFVGCENQAYRHLQVCVRQCLEGKK